MTEYLSIYVYIYIYIYIYIFVYTQMTCVCKYICVSTWTSKLGYANPFEAPAAVYLQRAVGLLGPTLTHALGPPRAVPALPPLPTRTSCFSGVAWASVVDDSKWYYPILRFFRILEYYDISYSITLHCTTLQYIPLHYTTLHYITLHYITLHYIALHHITLHHINYIALHYGTLHYIKLH